MIGYFGNVIFQTSDNRICNFNSFKQTASASYSDHNRYRKKPEREFVSPNNQGVSFTMKIIAGHAVSPREMKDRLIGYCEQGTVCPMVIGGHKIGGGNWTIDSIDADFKEVWNRGELVSVEITVTVTEYY